MDQIPLKHMTEFSRESGIPRNEITMWVNLFCLPVVLVKSQRGRKKGLPPETQARLLDLARMARQPAPLLSIEELAAMQRSREEVLVES